MPFGEFSRRQELEELFDVIDDVESRGRVNEAVVGAYEEDVVLEAGVWLVRLLLQDRKRL